MQSVHITTKVVSSNPVQDEVYSIQHEVQPKCVQATDGCLFVLNKTIVIFYTDLTIWIDYSTFTLAIVYLFFPKTKKTSLLRGQPGSKMMSLHSYPSSEPNTHCSYSLMFRTYRWSSNTNCYRDRRGRDRIVVRKCTTAIGGLIQSGFHQHHLIEM
jgi:hypothetical protein